MDEVAHKRHRRTRRSRYLVAAAALIIGGPVAAFAVMAGDDRGGGPVAADPHPTGPAEGAFFQHMTEKVSATDPTTRVGATVGMEPDGEVPAVRARRGGDGPRGHRPLRGADLRRGAAGGDRSLSRAASRTALSRPAPTRRAIVPGRQVRSGPPSL